MMFSRSKRKQQQQQQQSNNKERDPSKSPKPKHSIFRPVPMTDILRGPTTSFEVSSTILPPASPSSNPMHRRTISGPAFSEDIEDNTNHHQHENHDHEKNLGKSNLKTKNPFAQSADDDDDVNIDNGDENVANSGLPMMRNLYSPKESHPPIKQSYTNEKMKTPTSKRSSLKVKDNRRIIKRQVHNHSTTDDDHNVHELSTDLSSSSLICVMFYHGMEVIFATKHTGDDEESVILVICARSRVAFQKLIINSKHEIVSLVGNTLNGVVCASTTNGEIYTFYPVNVSGVVNQTSQQEQQFSAPFGRYHWDHGRTISCTKVFELTEKFARVGSLENVVHVSLSRNYFALVSFQDRMAVFDVSPYRSNKDGNAELLWCSSMDAYVMHAKISGDGCAIAVVLEGEGEGVPFPYGVRSFIREKEDDVKPTQKEKKDNNNDNDNSIIVGIIFKSGPFLVHSCPVTRLSWKGTGSDTGLQGYDNTNDIFDGNDYLLTHCKDSSLRVFSQSTFKQLMHWTTPPGSRADWIMGISCANIGDLDEVAHNKKNSKKKNSDSNVEENSDKISLISPHEKRGVANYLPTAFNASHGAGNSMINNQPIPSSSAGAWIAELTFRGPNPALRLSRLSYMKSGPDEFHPAHFESVAAILPRGGLVASAVLNGEESSFAVQGLWPVWNPWSSSVASMNSGLGGSHAPPSELRIVARHIETDKILIVELPLWGDKDFGAMEFGSPLMYPLSLATEDKPASDESTAKIIDQCVTYESSRLCARVGTDKHTLSLTWRKQGSMSILPYHQNNNYLERSSSSTSLNSDKLFQGANNSLPRKFQDVSICPLPISLPSLSYSKNVIIRSVQWLQEEEGQLPRLLVFSESHLYIYDIPPPWNAMEPPMPYCDPGNDAASSFQEGSQAAVSQTNDDDSMDWLGENGEYEVMITPHPDFGIGLRLEGHEDGRPAFVGSYKKHPLTGGLLPAERSGIISLGDELLAVNDESLEGISFEEVIETVRQVGANMEEELCLRFKKLNKETTSVDRVNSVVSHVSSALKGENAVEISGDEISAISDSGLIDNLDFFQAIGKIPLMEPLKENSLVLVLPWSRNIEFLQCHKVINAFLLFVIDGSVLKLYLLAVPLRLKQSMHYFLLSSIDLKKEIQFVTEVKMESTNDKWCIAVCDSDGGVTLVFTTITMEDGAHLSPSSFETSLNPCPAFVYGKSFSQDVLLRAHSTSLIGLMQKVENRCLEVQVWSALPTCHVKSLDLSDVNFHATTIPFDNLGVDDTILDFRWIPSGYLDAFPWLVTFSRSSSIVHRCSADTLKWISVIEISYTTLLSSTYLHPLKDPNRTKYIQQSLRIDSTYDGTSSPVDIYLHIIPAIKDIVSANDESHHICSDWHPDSILALLCTEEMGIKVAFQKHVEGLFTWLSHWLSPDESARPQWNSQLSQGVAPFNVVWNDDLVVEEDKKEESVSTLFSSPVTIPTENEVLRFELQAALSSRVNQILRKESGGKDQDNVAADLPEPLKKLNEDGLSFLLALGNIRSMITRFSKIDPCAQLLLFSLELVRQLSEDDKIDCASTTAPVGGAQAQNLVAIQDQHRNINLRESFALSRNSELRRSPGVAVSACISALLSNTQSDLISACRVDNKKLDWPTCRSMMLPFWLRNDDQCRKIAEEVAQDVFRQTKNVMECAIFYIALRKFNMLKSIAQTDRSESGKKFLSFLSHDFSSERGRKAAEKNAYSLLRKRQYGIAAAFFLLPEPPLIKSALEIIVTQMEDISLAFFIARLIEGGNMNGVGGAMGLQMQFTNLGLSTEKPKDYFVDWQPKLGPATINLLENRLLPLATDFNTLKSLILLWLGKEKDASRFIAGAKVDSTGDSNYDINLMAPTVFDKVETDMSVEEWTYLQKRKTKTTLLPVLSPICKPCDRVILKTNCLIDFMTAPTLLKAMNSDARVMCSSTLQLTSALIRRGIEISSLKSLLNQDLLMKDNIHDEVSGFDEEKEAKSNEQKLKAIDSTNVCEKSSIFDSFDVPPKPKPQPIIQTVVASTDMGSSIFDSFAVPAKPKPKPPVQNSGPSPDMSSSIFDSFDVPPKPQPPVQNSAPSGVMSSSVFDSFDVPAQPKPQPPVQSSALSADMSSSIFDSFDVPSKPKPQPPIQSSAPSTDMSSSIFDSFDVPPKPKPKPPIQNSAPSADMSSSIFDSFDAPPKPKAQPPVQNPTASGVMSSSIFDSFDAPQQSKPKSPGEVSSSIPNNFDNVGNSKELCDGIQLNGEKILHIPHLWFQWRNQLLVTALSRRLVREVARVTSDFHGEAIVPPMKLFRKQGYPLVPYKLATVLHGHCDGNAMVQSIRSCIEEQCTFFECDRTEVIWQALALIGSYDEPRRIVIAVLLYVLMNRDDLAETVVRCAAQGLLNQCDFFALSNDDIAYRRRTIFHIASQYIRRKAARVCWQLELCLWLHRGGAFSLSELALKEAIVSVRVGMLLASWSRSYESLEAMIRCEPDCTVDHDAGRQLWTSMKIMNNPEDVERKSGTCKSGGWEFLVDCKRDEATNMLRDRHAGSFLLRPHTEDHGVFTLSFKTNLVPTTTSSKKNSEKESNTTVEDSNKDSSKDDSKLASKPDGHKGSDSSSGRHVYPDDVVQHAIVRLSDAGFRCGSFGPFPSLLKLLEAVSTSLPFHLLFHEPPKHGIIKEQGGQPSPNSIFLRKLALHSKTDHYRVGLLDQQVAIENEISGNDTFEMQDEHIEDLSDDEEIAALSKQRGYEAETESALKKQFGMFSQLLVLTSVCKQLSSVAIAPHQDAPLKSTWQDDVVVFSDTGNCDAGSLDDDSSHEYYGNNIEDEDIFFTASRLIRPLIQWCRSTEVSLVTELLPRLADIFQVTTTIPIDVAVTDTAIELAPADFGSSNIDGGDAMVRRIIQPSSGVEFRTLRVGEGNQNAIVVLFSKKQAISWLITHGAERDEVNASDSLRRMEKRRVIEEIDLKRLCDLARGKGFMVTTTSTDAGDSKEGIRYRVVDPWEVEVLESKEAETARAALGREHLLSFNVSDIARSCEKILRATGGVHLLSLWNAAKGGIYLTKAIASTLPPWERDAGSDLKMVRNVTAESSPYMSSIRKHLYRNALFRRLRVPQRFLAILQIELLDLKNLTSPGGAAPLSAYALLRLKRSGSSNAPLNHKVRTLDSAFTPPKKIYRTSGPNAPASWGSLVRFRFVLPEDVNVDGTSFDMNREALYRGPPSVLQISVYEKKFMSDQWLGSADVKLNAVGIGDQLEEWVPLRAGKDGIVWFARIRITLRFELMCLDLEEMEASVENFEQPKEFPQSVGLKKMEQLSREGGVYEDSKTVKKSVGPDLISYLENMAAF